MPNLQQRVAPTPSSAHAGTRERSPSSAIALWVLASLLSSCGGGETPADATAQPAQSTQRAKALAVTAQQVSAAAWSAPLTLPLVPAAGAVLNNGKVLFWAGNSPTNFTDSGRTFTALYTPGNGSTTEQLVSETSHDMFCPGTALMADGRLLVNGGYDAGTTSLYNPSTNSWTRSSDMVTTRAYNASVPLADGSVLTLGGSWSGGIGAKPAELFTLTTGWRSLSGISTADSSFNTADENGIFRGDNHMWLIPTGNGRVLHAGPSKTMHWMDTRGNGSVVNAGMRADDSDSMNGNAVMYDAGKILTVGGSVNYEGSVSKTDAFVIDTQGGTAAARRVSPMAYPRLFANSVVLPNGQVVIVGGQTRGLPFSDEGSVLPAELYDPQTESFTTLAPMSVGRNYHSIALLLPDGRVLSAGGGLCDCAGDHPNMQVLIPPYLFNADGSAAVRPVVVSAPASVNYGSVATVVTNSPVTQFSMVRLGATTHTVNNDQRRVALAFTGGANNSYQVTIPSNAGILLPGPWMLFALNANGTPSVSKIITVSNTGAPVLQNPGDLSATVGITANWPVSASGGSGTVTYSATGLPPGLGINASTGAVSGVPTTAGRYVATVKAGNGAHTVSTDIVITVAPGTLPPAPVFHTPSVDAIADQQNTVGSGATLAISAQDPDRNPLTYSASGLPAGLAINTTSGVISGTLTTAGRFTVTVQATNAGGPSASTTFTWTVQNAALPQVVTLPAPAVASGATARFAPSLSNATGVQYRWDFGDGSSDAGYTGSPDRNHVYAAPGVYTVTLTMRAADGRSSTYQFIQAVYPSGASTLAMASSNVLLEPRSGASARLWVVNPDNDSVSVFDTANNARLAEIAVGTSPRSLTLARDGRIWVVNKQSASISIVSPTSLSVAQSISLPRASQPHGLVMSPADGNAFVALEASGQVMKLNGGNGATLASLNVGSNPRHLALTAAGTQLLVSRFITPPLPGEGTAAVRTTNASGAAVGGEVVIVNPATMAVLRTTVLAHSNNPDAENGGRGIPNYLGAAAISPDGKTAWVPSKKDNLLRGNLRDGLPLNFQNTVRAISSRIDLASGLEDLGGRVDHDNASLASAAVYHPTGAYLFVALETSARVAVMDAAGKRELFRFSVGLAPQGLAVSADGLKLYVSNFMGRSVSVIDLLPLVGFGQATGPVATLQTVATDKLPAQVLQGKRLFYDASDPRLARDSYMSCASCHNDGGQDGRTWDLSNLGEGLRNTVALKGRAGLGQGFLHWSANFDEVQDFEGQIRLLAGGTGLINLNDAAFNASGFAAALGTKKAGVSADLDALAAYVGSLNSFAQSPLRKADGTLTNEAQAGKAVFTANSCASCHGGSGFTTSSNAAGLKDIGTLKTSSGKRLGSTLPGIDIPTLRDVWATAPYLHDGSAATLAAAVQAHKGVNLSAGDLNNVVNYLQQIGSEEPAATVGSSPVPPANAVSCAVEGGACVLPAGVIADVYYGTNGQFFVKTGLSGTVDCSNNFFGDPNFGVVKACSYVVKSSTTPVPPPPPSGPVPPANAVKCAAEWGACVLPAGAVADVYYGANGKFFVKTGLSGTVDCSNYFFGDSNPGVIKACAYVVKNSNAPVPPANAVKCAVQGGGCSIPTGLVANVYYGANGKFVAKYGINGDLYCDNAIFEDPIPGVAKSCWYAVVGKL